jgi:membrane protein implicated in regulation of membrane protease activity
MHLEWWHWVSVGIIILLLEALTPGGFYLFFIGIAAILTGILTLFIPILWLQITIFAVLSIILIATLRKPMVNKIKKTTQKADFSEFIGETAYATDNILPAQEGYVEFRGTIWKAKNAGEKELPKNASCKITDREGLVLIVKPQ